MIAKRLRAPTAQLLDPLSSPWQRLPTEVLPLVPTPLASQVSAYVQVAWQGRGHGRIDQLRVSAAHNGEALLFRLQWRDETGNDRIADIDQFADAAAVLFPLKGDAVLATMGDAQRPVNAWYWQADLPRAINVTATGLGTTIRHKDSFLMASSVHEAGTWNVVIGRPFAVRGAGQVAVALAPGQTMKVAFAVWDGGNQERAGLKAVALHWQELAIQE